MSAVMEHPESVTTVRLNNPSRLRVDPSRLAAANLRGRPVRSMIQIARTGSFVSNRYGAFEITRDDLKTMLHNFQHVTPQAPTELPVDFDHLSMDVKHPGDGIAAGWIKRLELRDNGDTLQAEVEWTAEAAARIASQEYRFISPSFVKDYTYKDGQKIGATLLAAALTNHPFLESMAAVTLYNFSAMGDLAITAALVPARQEDPVTSTMAFDLADVGQRVSFADNEELTPELTPEERGAVYVVEATKGLGDDAFVKLKTLDDEVYGWFPATALVPAEAPDQAEHPPAPLTEPIPPPQEVVAMTADLATSQLVALAHQLVTERQLSLSAATKEAGHLRRDLVDARDATRRLFTPA